MRRNEYLRLREDQESVSAGVLFWDTIPFAQLQALEALLAARLAREQERLAAIRASQSRDQPEVEAVVRNETSRLTYLRALRYLREHDIAPNWPRGSVVMSSVRQ